MKSHLLPPWAQPAVALSLLITVLACGAGVATAPDAETDLQRDEAARLERQAQDLNAEGRHDAAQKVLAEAERPPEATELRQRLRHLQTAIEHLHAAGLHEPAEQLARQAEAMRRRLEMAPGEPRPAPLSRWLTVGRWLEMAPGEPRPAPEGMTAELNELRENVHELRRAVDELRHRVEELVRHER
jgi:hypothetical protein